MINKFAKCERLFFISAAILYGCVSVGSAAERDLTKLIPTDSAPLMLTVKPVTQKWAGGKLSASIAVDLISRTRSPRDTLSVGVYGAQAKFPFGWRREEPNINPSGRKRSMQQASKVFKDLAPGERRTERVKVRFSRNSRGYIYVQRQPNKFSVALYFATSDSDIYFSKYSEQHAEAERLNARLLREQVSDKERERRIRRIWRGGAQMKTKISPPVSRVKDNDPNNSIRFHGKASYKDSADDEHPIRNARVVVEGIRSGSTREILGETTTDGVDGRYEVVVPYATDLSLYVSAENVAARVIDPVSGEVYAIGSEFEPIVDDSDVESDLVAVSDLALPNNAAFEVLDAASYMSQFMVKLGEARPWPIAIKFPSTADIFTQNSGVRWIEIRPETSGVRFRWSRIFEEYAHYVQFLYGLSGPVAAFWWPEGGYLQEFPLCRAEYWVGPALEDTAIIGKDRAIKIAWTEGWARLFAGMAATEMKLSEDFQFGNLIDPWLEKPDESFVHGESSVYGVAGALWDIYDAADEMLDPLEVTYSAQYLWELSKESKAHSFSEFWHAFRSSRSAEELDDLGKVLVAHRFAPGQLAPPSTASGQLTFSWPAQEGCGTAEYTLRTFDNSSENLVWASPWQTSTTINVSGPRLERMRRGRARAFSAAVMDTGNPSTGPYQNFNNYLSGLTAPAVVPESLDLILLMNISGSMNNDAYGIEPREKKLTKLRRDLGAFASSWRTQAVVGDRIGVLLFDGSAKPIWARERFASPGGSTIYGPIRVLHPIDSNVDTVALALDPKPHPRFGIGRFFVNDECTSLGGALQAAFDIFDDESPDDREKAVMLFTDFEVQNQNPLIVGAGQARIQSVTSNELLAACQNREAFFFKPKVNPNPSSPDPKTIIVPDGQSIGSHNIRIFSSGIYGAEPRDEGAVMRSIIILNELASQTAGVFAENFTGEREDRDIYFTNDFLEGIGR